MKLYRFTLLFFDGTVITGKCFVGVPLNIQSIYLSIGANFLSVDHFSILNTRFITDLNVLKENVLYVLLYNTVLHVYIARYWVEQMNTYSVISWLSSTHYTCMYNMHYNVRCSM